MSPIRRIRKTHATHAGLALLLAVLVTVPAAISYRHGHGLENDEAAANPGPQAAKLATSLQTTTLAAVLGASGNLRAVIGTPSNLRAISDLQPVLEGAPLDSAGVHDLAVKAPNGDPLVMVSMVPFDATRGGRHGSYYTGRWPSSGLASRDARYAPPQGFISVTEENAQTAVSEHFHLRDFL